jgi:senataxin
VPTSKLNINVVPRPAQKKGLTTSLAQMKRGMRRDFGDRQKIGGITPSIPAASSVGSGLGAYQPPKTVAVQRPDSDTSEDSDSDDGGGMSQLINKSKIPIQVIQAEPIRPKLRYTDDAVHSEMRRRQLEKERHARRQKRLKPDLGPLFRFVLSWDPTSTDAQPPHPDRVKIQLGDAQPIPAAFGQADRYDRVMLPLFLQELWAQSLNDKALEQDIAVEVTSRSYEDDWIDVELAVVGPWPDRLYLNETDVVILSQPGNPKKIFARIQGVKKTFKQANIKVRIVGAMDVPSLIGKNKWLVRKHLS